MAIHTVVEPTNGHHIVYADDTLEAELARDVAQMAFDDTSERHAKLYAEAVAKIRAIHGADSAGWVMTDRRLDEDAHRQVREIEAAVAASEEELHELAERAARARRRHLELARRDSARHRNALLEASRLEQERDREEKAAGTTKSRRRLIGRLGK